MRKGIQFVAMIGCRKRATTVSVDPDTLFNFLSRKEYSPPFAKLLRAKTEDDFKELKKNNKWKKTETPQHAILVPIPSDLILAKPDMSPEEFLSTAAKLIREECIRLRLEKMSDKEASGNDGEDGASSKAMKIKKNRL